MDSKDYLFVDHTLKDLNQIYKSLSYRACALLCPILYSERNNVVKWLLKMYVCSLYNSLLGLKHS